MIKLSKKYDVIIVGTGVAGLNCAINLPEDKSVLVICKKTPDMSDSYLAQGGICCMVNDDDFEGYFEDTMRAGHYENNPKTVECMIKNSPQIIADLTKIGVRFERKADGSYDYTREGGHSRNRICFHEDCTGKEITTNLMKKARSKKNVIIVPYMTMLDIICKDNECYGIVAKDGKTGKLYRILADYTVLATGGIGGVFENSTNFRILTGDSLAICINHGVAVDHINYIQIHPTTLYSKKKGRRFLISESVRGEGAHLLDKNFNRFTDELQPRDVVTAAILKQMKKDGTDHVWLDMTKIPREEVISHFPTIVQRCLDEGYDVLRESIPVVPSQHYFMGGIRSDLNGKTTMQRLYAVGETCCNGVHGKNRLASNSLLESLLFAKNAAIDIKNGYCPVDMPKAKAAEKALSLEKYHNVNKLLKEYKQIVLNAIKEANENEQPDN
ncbi:MAG: L-aspartate oxidase [Clostridia bacterium]|nr:L-aspartate oxidase [Clostridia bacterium]